MTIIKGAIPHQPKPTRGETDSLARPHLFCGSKKLFTTTVERIGMGDNGSPMRRPFVDTFS